jgi:hypothetical protein
MPQPKKPARPRIDAIVRHIKAGSFDEEISQIQDAINERNKSRQDAVLRTVREVFGRKANVVIDTGEDQGPVPIDELSLEQRAAAKAKPKLKPGARRARPGAKPAEVQEVRELPPELAEAEAAALRRERELEAEAAGTEEPADEEANIISNSPVIGAIE